MTTIGFIGLGNMGGPMVKNLLEAGHTVKAFDLDPAKLDATQATKAESVADAVKGAAMVLTMLPAGPHVRDVYLQTVLDAAEAGALLIDCSTIDVESSRAVADAAGKRGLDMLDAPVSGGVGGAEAGTLTFMVGGSEAAFARGKPILEAMGKTIVHTGGSGNGQVAKICNNMILGATMIAVSEGFVMAENLGLDQQKLFDIVSTSSGSCFALTSHCPVPGPVPDSAANRDFTAGFTAAMMLKDLKLAQAAAQSAGVATPMGAAAAAMFGLFCTAGNESLDYSGIIKLIQGK
jgi:3-hydroxyisobutyrate dehydrogenase